MSGNRNPLAEATGLSDRILEDIQAVGKRYHVRKIVLFGSRARGNYQPKSDIDLAVYGCIDFPGMEDGMENDVWTLLQFDFIDMDGPVAEELKVEIERDGVTIYEKIR